MIVYRQFDSMTPNRNKQDIVVTLIAISRLHCIFDFEKHAVRTSHVLSVRISRLKDKACEGSWIGLLSCTIQNTLATAIVFGSGLKHAATPPFARLQLAKGLTFGPVCS